MSTAALLEHIQQAQAAIDSMQGKTVRVDLDFTHGERTLLVSLGYLRLEEHHLVPAVPTHELLEVLRVLRTQDW